MSLTLRQSSVTGAVTAGTALTYAQMDANFSGLADGSLITSLDSSKVPFLQSGTGAVARPVQTKLREWVSITDYGGVADGVTANDTALTNAFAVSNRVYFPGAASAYAFASTIALNGNKRIYGDGGLTQRSQITYTGSGVAIQLTSTFNGIEGIGLTSNSATDGIKLLDSSQNILRDFYVASGPTRGLYLTSSNVSLGCAWNSFQQFKVFGTTALQMDQSGAGFVNLNTFITGSLRTSAASTGTVATLTTSHENTFIDIDASNYGGGTVTSWNIAGTSNNNKWFGGLIDTPTGTLTGFLLAAGVNANKVVGMTNLATTPYSSIATPITDMTREVYLDNNGNFFGELRLSTPAFGAAGPGINFFDTGNTGAQLMYGLNGRINWGPSKASSKASIDPTTGDLLVGNVRSAVTAVTLANGLNSDIALGLGVGVNVHVTGPTGVFSVGGFTNPTDGKVLDIYNAVAFAMTIVNEDASSTAANRIKTCTGANVTLRAGISCATLKYDGTDQRWILRSTN